MGVGSLHQWEDRQTVAGDRQHTGTTDLKSTGGRLQAGQVEECVEELGDKAMELPRAAKENKLPEREET